jgi:polysaccharide export outer membrane protein
MTSRAIEGIGLGFALIVCAGALWAQEPAATEGKQPPANPATSPAPAQPASPQATTANEQPAMAAAAEASPSAGSATKPHDNSFIIGNTDLLSINVWKEPDVSRSLPVRSDGRISLPLVGEVQAAGKTPLQLERDITSKLQHFITDPQVTVMVQQINSEKFNILGQVAKPGAYPLTIPTTILDAIALAGGFRDFAKQKGIYVLRQDAKGANVRIPFNYKDVIKGKNPEQNITLEPRDTIVVP